MFQEMVSTVFGDMIGHETHILSIARAVNTSASYRLSPSTKKKDTKRLCQQMQIVQLHHMVRWAEQEQERYKLWNNRQNREVSS